MRRHLFYADRAHATLTQFLWQTRVVVDGASVTVLVPEVELLFFRLVAAPSGWWSLTCEKTTRSSLSTQTNFQLNDSFSSPGAWLMLNGDSFQQRTRTTPWAVLIPSSWTDIHSMKSVPVIAMCENIVFFCCVWRPLRACQKRP